MGVCSSNKNNNKDKDKKDSKDAKEESKEFVCTYVVKDINKDVAEFNTSWAFTLEQA